MDAPDTTYRTNIRLRTKNGPSLALVESPSTTQELLKLDISKPTSVFINQEEALKLARMFEKFGRTGKLPVGDKEPAEVQLFKGTFGTWWSSEGEALEQQWLRDAVDPSDISFRNCARLGWNAARAAGPGTSAVVYPDHEPNPASVDPTEEEA